jgi:predicted ATP-grasp superfamily ATP-dependent carboligase
MVPDALTKPMEFAGAIAALAAAEHAAVVLPISEQALLAILPIRGDLLPAVVPFPELDAFSALSDKQRLLDEALKLGIATPKQVALSRADALASIDLSALRYPIVLKPARSVSDHGGVRAKVSVSYAADSTDLRRKIDTLPPAAFPLLLQERVVGPGIGIFILLWEGAPRAEFAHRRLCEKPPSGGVSVYRESVSMDEELRDKSRALLDRFGWYGPAMVEYKRDSATGQPYLMEVNGRFWGSLQLAIDSGVDFPRLLVECALGEISERVHSYRVGVRSRWWWGQVDHLVGRVRPRSTHAPVPPEILSASRAVGDLLLGPFRYADYEEVLRWDDPRPFWNETIRWIGAK